MKGEGGQIRHHFPIKTYLCDCDSAVVGLFITTSTFNAVPGHLHEGRCKYALAIYFACLRLSPHTHSQRVTGDQGAPAALGPAGIQVDADVCIYLVVFFKQGERRGAARTGGVNEGPDCTKKHDVVI